MMMAYDFASCEEIQCNLPHRPAPFLWWSPNYSFRASQLIYAPHLGRSTESPHSWWTAVIRTSTMCDRAICCCKWGKGSKSGSGRLRTHFDIASTLWHEKRDPKRTLSKLNENMLQGVDWTALAPPESDGFRVKLSWHTLRTIRVYEAQNANFRCSSTAHLTYFREVKACGCQGKMAVSVDGHCSLKWPT